MLHLKSGGGNCTGFRLYSFMKIVCISDTHNRHRELALPPGDILIHAGDFTEAGTKTETMDFLKWFSAQPHQYKLLIPGNHDFYFEKHLEQLDRIIPPNIQHLINRGIKINNIKFWGSPVTPGYGSWAFNKSPGREIQQHWELIPADTDFLVTHGPPYKILDELENKMHVGCEKLLTKIKTLKIPHHIFGHIHDDYGIIQRQETIFLNASSLSNNYHHINAPLVWELPYSS